MVDALGEMPERSIREIFPMLDVELKTRVLGDHYRRSTNTSFSLLQRTRSLRSVLLLFSLLSGEDEEEALEVFHAFKDRWGLVGLFRELDLPEVAVDQRTPEDIFRLFKTTLQTYLDDEQTPQPALIIPKAAAVPSKPTDQPAKSLKDRIEEARNSAAFPSRVIEVIDKNKLNTVGTAAPSTASS